MLRQPLIKRSRYSSLSYNDRIALSYNDRIALESRLRAERSKTCPRVPGYATGTAMAGGGPPAGWSADRAGNGPPASETVLGLVVPAQLALALQPAEQHGVPVEFGWEVQ